MSTGGALVEALRRAQPSAGNMTCCRAMQGPAAAGLSGVCKPSRTRCEAAAGSTHAVLSSSPLPCGALHDEWGTGRVRRLV